MSASYFPVTGYVVSDAARQRIRVGPVVFEFGKRLSSLRGAYLAIRIRLFGVGFLHADETRLFESTAITRINNLKMHYAFISIWLKFFLKRIHLISFSCIWDDYFNNCIKTIFEKNIRIIVIFRYRLRAKKN